MNANLLRDRIKNSVEVVQSEKEARFREETNYFLDNLVKLFTQIFMPTKEYSVILTITLPSFYSSKDLDKYELKISYDPTNNDWIVKKNIHFEDEMFTTVPQIEDAEIDFRRGLQIEWLASLKKKLIEEYGFEEIQVQKDLISKIYTLELQIPKA